MAKRLNGEGSIKERSDGRWEAKIQVGKKPDGKPAIKYFYGKTKREAKKKLDTYRALAHPTEEQMERITVEEYILNWLATVKINELKPRAYDTLEGAIQNYVVPHVGFYGLADLTGDIIQKELINTLSQKGYAHSTIKKAYDALNACLKFATLRGAIPFNPMQTVSKPSKKKFKKKAIEILTDEEVKKLVEVAPFAGRYGQAIVLMAYTGLRVGEAIALKWKDWNEDARLLSVTASLVQAKNRSGNGTAYKLLEQDSTKTDNGTRTIYLSKNAIAAIELLKKQDYRGKKNDYIICTQKYTPLYPRNLQRTFDHMLKDAGIPHMGLHALRHTFASLLIRKGIDIKIVSELLGHADVTFTYNTYVHIINEQKNKAILMLDEI